jgi:hypothetical protein
MERDSPSSLETHSKVLSTVDPKYTQMYYGFLCSGEREYKGTTLSFFSGSHIHPRPQLMSGENQEIHRPEAEPVQYMSEGSHVYNTPRPEEDNISVQSSLATLKKISSHF